MEYPEWKPTKYLATCCQSIIWSAHPGRYKECQCGKSFVDQTEYYVRLGGTVTQLEEEK